MGKTRVLNIISGGLLRDGITSSQLEYMRNWNSVDIQVDIAAVCNDIPEVISQFEKYGCNVIKFPNRIRKPFAYTLALIKAIRKNKYDVVHVHGSSALLAWEMIIAKLCRVRIRIAHSRNTMNKHKKLDSLLRPLFYSSYTKALACGEDAGHFLFTNRPFTVLHNGKDFSKFIFRNDIREEQQNKLEVQGKHVLGYVGGLNEQKNVFFLIDTLEKVRLNDSETVLVVVGDGPLREQLHAYVDERGLTEHVIFTGRIDNVHEVIQACDVMLLPSFYEGLPNVVLEWQIAGLPCLISDRVTKECAVTDLAEFIPIDQGVDLWAEKIYSLMQQNLDRSSMSKVACVEMERAGFEIRSSIKMLEEIYQGK